MREVSKLAILDYAKTKKFREGKSDEFREANENYVKGVFQVGISSSPDSDAKKNMINVANSIHRDRLQIKYMLETLNKRNVGLDTINREIGKLVKEFEDNYGIKFDSQSREGEFLIVRSVDDYLQELGWGNLDPKNESNIINYIYNNDLGLGVVQ